MDPDDTDASTAGGASSDDHSVRPRGALRTLAVALAIAATVGLTAFGAVGAAATPAGTAMTADGGAVPAGSVSSQSGPTLVVADGTVEPGSTADHRVSLTEAPDGLAGFKLTLAVDDGDVATIENATYPDHYGLTTDPVVSADGEEITVEAADIGGEITDGTTDVTLATLELEGVDDGETDLRVTESQVDADGGDPVAPSLEAGTVTVGDETDETPSRGGSNESDASNESDDETDDESPGFAIGAAVAALAVCAAVLIERVD